MVVRVGHLKPQETLPFKVSRRGNADLSTALVQVNVPGNVAGRDDVYVRVDIQEVGFLSGNDIVGSLLVPLRELVDKGCIAGEKRLRTDLTDSQMSDDAGDGFDSGCERVDRGRGGRPVGLDDGKGGCAKIEIRWVGTFT